MRALDGGGVGELCYSVLQRVECAGDLRVDAGGVAGEVGRERMARRRRLDCWWLWRERDAVLRCAGRAAPLHRVRRRRGRGLAGGFRLL